MKEIYSKADDCYELAKYLKRKLGIKIDFYGNVHQEVISGSYYSVMGKKWFHLYGEGLPFYFKFCKEGFLRIGVGSFYSHVNTIGEKLAALSCFYEILREQFGEPTVFYTIKDDDEGNLTLQWSFTNKEEEIQAFKSDTYFDDAKIDRLIVIGEAEAQIDECKLSDATKYLISKQIGLPLAMAPLVDENINEFTKYKMGIEAIALESEKSGAPSQEVMSLERTKK